MITVKKRQPTKMKSNEKKIGTTKHTHTAQNRTKKYKEKKRYFELKFMLFL